MKNNRGFSTLGSILVLSVGVMSVLSVMVAAVGVNFDNRSQATNTLPVCSENESDKAEAEMDCAMIELEGEGGCKVEKSARVYEDGSCVWEYQSVRE